MSTDLELIGLIKLTFAVITLIFSIIIAEHSHVKEHLQGGLIIVLGIAVTKFFSC